MSIQKYNSGVQSNKAKVADSATVANVSGGVAGSVPYQSGPSVTAVTGAGIAGNVLTSNGSSAPTWANPIMDPINLSPALNSVVMFNGYGSTPYATSSNGISWTVRSVVGSLAWRGMAYGNGRFILTTNGQNTRISTDGLSWSNGGLMPAVYNWKHIAYGNGNFVSTADTSVGNAATSTDGISWTARTLPITATWRGIAYGNGTFCILSSSSIVITSTDGGVTWSNRSIPSFNWTGITYGNGMFVTYQSNSTVAASSTDGITWTQRTLPATTYWSAATHTNGVFLISGVIYSTSALSALARSTDGITWSTATLPQNGFHYVTNLDGKFIAVNQNSSSNIAISTNGVTWTQYTSSNMANLNLSILAAGTGVLAPKTMSGDFPDIITVNTYAVGSYDKWLNIASTGIHTVTLPAPALSLGREIVIKQTSSFAVNSASSNVKPLTSQTVGTAILSGAGKYAKLVSNGTHWVIMEAN